MIIVKVTNIKILENKINSLIKTKILIMKTIKTKEIINIMKKLDKIISKK
jgi:hypothetical protein